MVKDFFDFTVQSYSHEQKYPEVKLDQKIAEANIQIEESEVEVIGGD